MTDINSAHSRKWITGLRNENQEVGAFSLNPARDDWHEQNQVTLYHAGIDLSTTKSNVRSKTAYLFSGKKVRAAVNNFKPDVVHAHYASSYGLLARQSGRPYLLSVWGSDVFDFPHQNRLYRRIAIRNLTHAAEILATGKALADEVLKLSGRESTIVPFGIDTDVFHPSKKLEASPFTFVIVKSLEPIYGIDLAIEAITGLADCKLVIVGSGSLENELKQKVLQLGLENRVEFRGYVPNNEIPSILQESDCFLNLSRRESFGVSILEAMACGIPVIATRTHGAEELIAHQQDGILIPVDSLDELRSAMRKMMTDQVQTSAIAKSGREKVLNQYNLKENIIDLIRLYEQHLQ